MPKMVVVLTTTLEIDTEAWLRAATEAEALSFAEEYDVPTIIGEALPADFSGQQPRWARDSVKLISKTVTITDKGGDNSGEAQGD